jgi:hypothetical protein
MSDQLSDERIIQLAKREEGFAVSLRWRDDGLRARCANLVREGKLIPVRVNGKKIYKGYLTFEVPQ